MKCNCFCVFGGVILFILYFAFIAQKETSIFVLVFVFLFRRLLCTAALEIEEWCDIFMPCFGHTIRWARERKLWWNKSLIYARPTVPLKWVCEWKTLEKSQPTPTSVKSWTKCLFFVNREPNRWCWFIFFSTPRTFMQSSQRSHTQCRVHTLYTVRFWMCKIIDIKYDAAGYK